jgi:hypothetical protein
MPIFKLKLEKSYFNKGFFNVRRDYDQYVRHAEGPVRLRLGSNGVEVEANLSRHANGNGTPRIFGGVPLRNWFQQHFDLMDTVAVDLSSEDVIVLDPSGTS